MNSTLLNNNIGPQAHSIFKPDRQTPIQSGVILPNTITTIEIAFYLSWHEIYELIHIGHSKIEQFSVSTIPMNKRLRQ